MSCIAITGAQGNLGWKLVCHLVQLPHVDRLLGVSHELPTGEQLSELRQLSDCDKAEFTQCDLADFADSRWRAAIDVADAVVHFAAQNPYPEATWEDSARSLDMTLGVALASADAGVRRLVFASSNHVMGRYKDPPLAERIGPGELSTDLAPGVGTIWQTGLETLDSTAYATAKHSGELLCHALALRGISDTEFVCVRIGWCQPGENSPATLSGAGTPTVQAPSSGAADRDFARNDRWFKLMWLSNRDFKQLYTKAIFADSGKWPEPFIVVNGTSGNLDMPWSLKEGREWLGYEPQDGTDQQGNYRPSEPVDAIR